MNLASSTISELLPIELLNSHISQGVPWRVHTPPALTPTYTYLVTPYGRRASAQSRRAAKGSRVSPPSRARPRTFVPTRRAPPSCCASAERTRLLDCLRTQPSRPVSAALATASLLLPTCAALAREGLSSTPDPLMYGDVHAVRPAGELFHGQHHGGRESTHLQQHPW